jgi:hypothetical protein
MAIAYESKGNMTMALNLHKICVKIIDKFFGKRSL